MITHNPQRNTLKKSFSPLANLRKIFRKHDRVLVVYDGGYLAALSKNLDIHRFQKLVHFFSGSVPYRSIWFGTRNPNRNDDRFFDLLNASKIEAVSYRLALRTATCEHCGAKSEKTIQKGVDVGIAMTVLKGLLLDEFDRLVLVAGDGDFSELIQEVRNEHKDVYVLGTNDTIAESIKVRASRVFDLGEFFGMCKKGALEDKDEWAWKQISKAIPTK